MKRTALLALLVLALAAAGGASAYALKTIMLKPGHCTKVHKVKVCARKVAAKTVTVTPSPIGETFTGNGSKTLDPVTLSHGVTVQWTAQPDSAGNNQFFVNSSPDDTHFIEFDNGDDGATSGSSYLPPGTYTLEVGASAAWTLKF